MGDDANDEVEPEERDEWPRDQTDGAGEDNVGEEIELVVWW